MVYPRTGIVNTDVFTSPFSSTIKVRVRGVKSVNSAHVFDAEEQIFEDGSHANPAVVKVAESVVHSASLTVMNMLEEVSI